MAKTNTQKGGQPSPVWTGKGFELRFLCDFMKFAEKKPKYYNVFQPLIDDNGIDFVIRTKNREYKDIQVKGRSNNRTFTIAKKIKAHPNYWFVFYCKNSKDGSNYDRYIMNSKDVKPDNNNHIRFPVGKQNDDFDNIFKDHK